MAAADRSPDDLEADTKELYQHAPCAHLSTLHDGTIIRVNQTFLDWIGLDRDAIIGTVRFQSLLSVGARIYYETHYAPLLQMQGFVNEIALEMRRGDGTICPVVASARQVRDANGAVTVNRVALFDSTDRRRYERELLHARQRAEDAAMELAAADRRKNDFIAMLAHELRNPLAPIRTSIEILNRSDSVRQAAGRTTAILQRQAAQLSRLVEDLLDISRVGQGKLSVQRVPVDLASVVHHAVETSEPLLEAAGLTFTASLPNTPIYVEADATRLSQVIGNVLNNAAKFTPHGGSVRLLLERDADSAVIRIRDTGIGIEAAQLARVFEMFMQADLSLGSKGGLGIGLTLAKNLVERHGGEISVSSEGPGQGAEFVVRLPAMTAVPDSVSRSFPSGPEVREQPRRILVVDDNHDSAEAMALLLGAYGHDLRVAHDGFEAVALSGSFEPHIVLLDIGLPGLNGYEVAERIRAHEGSQPVLVALTGWGQDKDRKRSSDAGFNAHLVKPVDYDELTTLIADLPSQP